MLEVVRNVNVGQDLVRPTVERLCGSRQISAYFKSNPDQEALGRATRALLQTPPSSDSPTYSAVGGEWVRNSLPPPPRALAARGVGAPPPVSVEQQLDDIAVRLSTLVALQEGLFARLARLEARLVEGAVPDFGSPWGGERVALRGVSSSDPRVAPSALSAQASRVSEPGAAEPAAAELPPPPAAVLAAAEPSAAAAPTPAPVVASAVAPLELPPPAELAKCISLLVGNVSIEPGTDVELSATTSDYYAAGLEAEGGKLVGLVVMDLKATVFLGGTLMMQPREQLEQQFAAHVPEQDSIAASAEICNALSSAINGTQSRYHVRAASLAKFAFASHPWVAAPAARRDLLDSFGGRTSVLAHPLA